jgi:hypothetical protein
VRCEQAHVHANEPRDTTGFTGANIYYITSVADKINGQSHEVISWLAEAYLLKFIDG